MRSTKHQPFCWQEKKILRLFKKEFEGAERIKYICLYTALTWIDSDFNQQDIKYYTKTISTYSGLSTDWIPGALKKLEKLGIVEIKRERIEGKFVGNEIVFTPENIKEIPLKTITGKPGTGETITGESAALEDISFQEDISLKENHSRDIKSCDINKRSTNTTKNNVKGVEIEFQYVELAMLLFNEHKKRDDKFLHGQDVKIAFNRWAKDIRLLIEKDGRALSTVRDVIIWCQQHEGRNGFTWASNILSGSKLRKQFPTLYAQWQAEAGRSGKAKTTQILESEPWRKDYAGAMKKIEVREDETYAEFDA